MGSTLRGQHPESQYDIAALMNAKDWGMWRGAYADDLVRTARFSNLSKAVQNPGLIGFKKRSLGYSAVSNFWSDGGSADPDYPNRYNGLKSIVAAGHPLVMLTWYDATHKVGHFRILKGYDDSTSEFIVNDPWYSAPYYGPDIRFNQSFLVDDLWPGTAAGLPWWPLGKSQSRPPLPSASPPPLMSPSR